MANEKKLKYSEVFDGEDGELLCFIDQGRTYGLSVKEDEEVKYFRWNSAGEVWYPMEFEELPVYVQRGFLEKIVSSYRDSREELEEEDEDEEGDSESDDEYEEDDDTEEDEDEEDD